MRRHKSSVYGLVSIVLVMSILLLLPILCPRAVDREAVTRSRLSSLAVALLAYKADYGTFPRGDTSAIIRRLRGCKTKRREKGYFEPSPPDKTFYETNKYSRCFDKDEHLLDGWGRIISISFSGEGGLLLESKGKNGVFDAGGDDITFKAKLPDEVDGKHEHERR